MLLASIIIANIPRARLSYIKQYHVYTTDLLFDVLASITTSSHIIPYSHDNSVSRQLYNTSLESEIYSKVN